MIPLPNTRRFFYKALKQPRYALGVLAMRLKNYFSYFSGDGKSFYPEAVTLFLTYNCNLRCKMCGQWGESGVTKKKPLFETKAGLSFIELKDLIDDLSSFRPNITLFGGEPLLYPDLAGLVKYIKEKNMHCLLITNGSLIESYAEGLIESGLDELNVSLDGASQLHDEIRGLPGLFESIVRGLKKIKQLKLQKKTNKPLVNLQCTITRYNYQHLKQLLDVADDVGADSLAFHHLVFLDKEQIKKQKEYDEAFGIKSCDWDGFVFDSGIDPDLLFKQVREILKGRYNFTLDFYPNFSLDGLRNYYQNFSCLASKNTGRCLSPWMVAYIFPDAEVRPCLNFTNSYGNIKQEKFAKLWNNAQAQRFRSTLKQNKAFPVCFRCTELYRY